MQSYRTCNAHDGRGGFGPQASQKRRDGVPSGMLARPDSFAVPSYSPASAAAFPAWARAAHAPETEAEAGFLAGAALARLDAVVRENPPWAGAWRQRLALAGVRLWKTVGLGETRTPRSQLLRRAPEVNAQAVCPVRALLPSPCRARLG
jgi:Protein of unknown function (DUF1403)